MTGKLYLLLAMVPDHHTGSGSVSDPNWCQIDVPGCQLTQSVNSGTIRWQTPNLSALGELSAGHPVGPSIDVYNVLVFAVG